MPFALRATLVAVVFLIAIVLVVTRPRGWSEAWWTSSAAALLLALGLVQPRHAFVFALSSKDALLFLLGLLLLSALVARSGFFAWAALHCARLAKGDGGALYRNVFVLGALVTAVLSLDTTAVLLTPLVLELVERLRLPTRPYVLTCAFVANVGSLLLPTSNLTNLLLLDALDVTFAGFALRMLLPQVLVLAGNYFLFKVWFSKEMPARFETSALAEPMSVVPDKRYFLCACWTLLAVCAGYFVAPLISLPVYWVALAGSVALAIGAALTIGRKPSWARDLPLDVFPFVLGLFVLVAAVEQLGVAQQLSEAMRAVHSTLLRQALSAGGAAVLSNVVNNLPAALFARSALHASTDPHSLWYALIGTNIGSCITPVGSLATLLVLGVARRRGQPVATLEVMRVSVIATPILLVIATAAFALGARLF